MRRFIRVMGGLLAVSLSANSGTGFDLFRPESVGGQFIGTRQDASQMPGSGVGPGISLFLRYNLSPRVLLDLSTGLSTATDDVFMADRTNVLLFPNFTLKTNFKMVRDAKLTPIFYTGLMSSYATRKDTYWDKTTKKTSYSDLCVLLGSGFIYQSYFNFNITVNADYRYSFYSSKDLDIKPQYWVFETGLSFPIGREVKEPDFAEDFISTEEENEIAVEEPAVIRGNDDFAVFLRKVESLLNRIEDKQKQLEDLEARVIANEKAIATVTGYMANEFVNYTDVLAAYDTTHTYEDYMTLYQNSLNQYNSKQYAQAIRMFEKLLVLNRMHPLSSNCQYWIGESHYELGDFTRAAAAFNSVLEYALSSKYDDALLMNGVCQMKLGNSQAAREYFSELVTRYPESEYSGKAGDYLKTL